MAADKSLPPTVFIGWDAREAVAAEVCKHSIIRRTHTKPEIRFLKHRDLRKLGMFKRQWLIEPQTGEYIDGVDGKRFSTEFSHTRFLIPALMNYQGWALFMDSDMIFLSDIAKLWAMRDDKYAIMCVKHEHSPTAKTKMDEREQLVYPRKNWSSFVLWNCTHDAHKLLTPQAVNTMAGSDLHSFSWLPDKLIGAIPFTYNFIANVSPRLPLENGGRPHVVHYTEGGPWFENCKNVLYGDWWIDEYENFQLNSECGHKISHIPSQIYAGTA